MAGLESPDHGSIKIADKNLKNLKVNELSILRNKYLGFIYQFHHLLPDFSVKENIMMPFIIRGDSNNINISKLFSITKKLGLENRINHYPNQLSGGERQRVAIARAIITSPEIILADEPTGNLDNKNANLVFNSFIELAEEVGTSIILVTHDLSLAKKMNKIYNLSQGKIKVS
jgi:lipoprotein-releasing system ATP-binding protein